MKRAEEEVVGKLEFKRDAGNFEFEVKRFEHESATGHIMLTLDASNLSSCVWLTKAEAKALSVLLGHAAGVPKKRSR